MKSNLRVIALAALVAACTASCPNDCSQHGTCNINSACECYRNWMGADCSQRVCYFGHSFVDTPQGDLNADGRVDRADIWKVTVMTDVGVGTAAQIADGTADHLDDLADGAEFATFQANQFLYSHSSAAADLSTVTVSAQTAFGVVVHTSVPLAVTADDPHTTTAQYNVGFELSVITSNGGDPDRGDDGLRDGEFVFVKSIASIGDNGDFELANPFDDIDLATNTTWRLKYVNGATSFQENAYTYNTQFTNKATWERFPTDHGAGHSNNTLKEHWDEGHFYAECSGKGICDRSSGSCDCFDGYSGEGCTRTSCPNDCSGHGVCRRLGDINEDYAQWDREKTQACVCDAGYTNVDCSGRICPSGDDPITRPWDSNADENKYVVAHADSSDQTDDFFSQLPHSQGDEPEIQIFGYVEPLAEGSYFALEFTDEFGDKWVTNTLDMRSAGASDVEDALEKLPNSVIQNVEVSVSFFPDNMLHKLSDSSVTADDDTTTCSDFAGNDGGNPCEDESHACCGLPRVWAITFLANSGNLAPLGVRFEATNTDAVTKTDDDGEFIHLGLCEGESADWILPCLEIVADTETALDIEEAIMITGASPIGTTDENGDFVYSSSADESNEVKLWWGSDASDEDGSFVFLSNARDGSQENTICSNRGLCDFETGVCKCFNGFTDDDCSVQNALAMY